MPFPVDLNAYRADWRREEVAVVTRRSSRSRSRSPVKSSGSIRSVSPTKSLPPVKEAIHLVISHEEALQPVYPTQTNEFLSRMESDQKSKADLEDYHVGWKKEEMKGLKSFRKGSSPTKKLFH